MREIKKTKSLSPVSCRVVDASVVLDDGKVYLVKQDENGTTYKTLIEQDYEFYRMMTAESITEPVESSILFFYVSDRCNLGCAVCFEGGGKHQELSLSDMRKLCGGIRNKSIVLMGREPTCREDIFELIRLAKRHNRAILTTNGIRLADYDFVVRLKKAGLSIISLTFNGFDDSIYEKLNDRPLAGIKLQALANIRSVGIKTTLSISLVRGVNENQIRRLADYCFDNRSFVYQLRIRTAQKIGACPDVEPFTMSELINLFADALNIPREDIVKEHIFWKELLQGLGPLASPRALAIVRARLCAYSVTVIRDPNGYSCLGGRLDMEALKKKKFRTVRYAYDFIKAVGPRYIAEYFCALTDIPFKPGPSDCLMVGFRCWPNIYNIDLRENFKCSSRYYRHGEFVPFCYSNIVEAQAAPKGGIC